MMLGPVLVTLGGTGVKIHNMRIMCSKQIFDSLIKKDLLSIGKPDSFFKHRVVYRGVRLKK